MASKDFYSPGELVFSRDQCIWLIANWGFLEDGKWPTKPSVYSEALNVMQTKSGKAPFEWACLVRAELSFRLKTTKEAGEALFDEVQGGITNYELLSRPAKKALNYISGFRRRKQTFSQWKKYNRKRVSL